MLNLLIVLFKSSLRMIVYPYLGKAAKKYFLGLFFYEYKFLTFRPMKIHNLSKDLILIFLGKREAGGFKGKQTFEEYFC